MDEKLLLIKEAATNLIETASSGVEHARKAADLIKDESLKKALVDVCNHFEKTFEPLTINVDGRIAHIVELQKAAEKRKERIANTDSRIKEKLENLKKLRGLLAEKLKSIPKPEIKSLKKETKPSEPQPHAELLSAQQLVDQIRQKIPAATNVPKSTGNIWENWGQSRPDAASRPPESQPKKDGNP